MKPSIANEWLICVTSNSIKCLPALGARRSSNWWGIPDSLIPNTSHQRNANSRHKQLWQANGIENCMQMHTTQSQNLRNVRPVSLSKSTKISQQFIESRSVFFGRKQSTSTIHPNKTGTTSPACSGSITATWRRKEKCVFTWDRERCQIRRISSRSRGYDVGNHGCITIM